MTQHFIVIGNPINHSKSPSIHHSFADQVGLDLQYTRQFCPNDVGSFEAVVDAFFAGGGVGANVTVPFKQMAFDRCQAVGALSAHAQVAGAVNTLSMAGGTLYGDNTDGLGLVTHLRMLGWLSPSMRIAIIGAGGAARGVILPLCEAGATCITVANRTVQKAAMLVQTLQQKVPSSTTLSACGIDELTGSFDLIINATSSGLSGDSLTLADSLATCHAYDMMYGRPLPFIEHFKRRQAAVSDGFGMLVGQAALSFEHWTGRAPNVQQAMRDLHDAVYC